MARNQTNKRNRKRESVPPALIAYHVADRGEKGFWTRIGAAWEHQDGEGFTIQLDLIPNDGGRIVLRPLKDDEETGTDETETEKVEETEDEEGA